MKLIIIVTALLGVGLQIRMLQWLRDPELFQTFGERWELLSSPSKIAVIFSMMIPFIYYVFCGAVCFVKRRSWIVNLLGICVFSLAGFYFAKLDEITKICSNNAAFLAVCSLAYYLAKPRSLAVTTPMTSVDAANSTTPSVETPVGEHLQGTDSGT